MTAILLVFHGSRDARPQQAMNQLAEWMRIRLAERYITPALVDTATLELGELTLSEQIQRFSDRARCLGLAHLHILPLFLLAGTHVMEDIPAQIAIAQQQLGSNYTLNLLPHLGCHPAFAQVVQQHLLDHTPQRWVLLSHGSRRPGGNQSVIDLATQLNAVPAFWAVPPALDTQITALVEAGYYHIGIMPYFLFPGRILDAIAAAIAQLQADLKQRLPSLQLELAQPIQATPALADLLLSQFARSQSELIQTKD